MFTARTLKHPPAALMNWEGEEMKSILSKMPETPARESFRPYLKTITLRNQSFRFFFATPEARDWYDPLKPYAKLEYEWVIDHIPLADQRIIDGGAHHGQYAVLFGLASAGSSRVVAVDAVESNCAITEVNLALNGLKAEIVRSAISQVDGFVNFSPESNGHIVANGGEPVPSRRLMSILPDATVVKLDVEGAEFWILPDAIDVMPAVRHWIVEVHPTARRDARTLTRLFEERDYRLHWVNRATGVIEKYPEAAIWTTHTTIFASR